MCAAVLYIGLCSTKMLHWLGKKMKLWFIAISFSAYAMRRNPKENYAP